MGTEDKIIIMQAFVDGKTIQRDLPNGAWVDMNDSPVWNWRDVNYRIKPEPKIIYVNDVAGGLGSFSSRSYLAFNTYQEALLQAEPYETVEPIQYIELTDEIKQKLNIK